MSRQRKLTIKQQAFADFYIELGNATQAAIKAGYSKRSARQIGEQNLSKHDIKTYIDERMEELKSERVADQQEILEFLTSVIRGEVEEPVPIMTGKGKQKVVKLLPPVNVRKAAAVDLGKRYAMWTDKQRVEGTVGVTIVDDIEDDEE